MSLQLTKGKTKMWTVILLSVLMPTAHPALSSLIPQSLHSWATWPWRYLPSSHRTKNKKLKATSLFPRLWGNLAMFRSHFNAAKRAKWRQDHRWVSGWSDQLSSSPHKWSSSGQISWPPLWLRVFIYYKREKASRSGVHKPVPESQILSNACFVNQIDWNTATSIHHLSSVAASVLQKQNRVLVTDTIWSAKPQILTAWPFTAKVWQPLS